MFGNYYWEEGETGVDYEVNDHEHPQDFDAVWGWAYEGLLMDAHTFLPVYEEKEWWIHAGITKILQAYTLVTGAVPERAAWIAISIPSLILVFCFC